MTRREIMIVAGLLLAVLGGGIIRTFRKGWTPAAPSPTLTVPPAPPPAAP